MQWKCPNGHAITRGVVCGGDTPFHNWNRANGDPPNAYFLIDVQTGQYLREPHGFSEDLNLRDQDWKAMFAHAHGGCGDEPICPQCANKLVPA